MQRGNHHNCAVVIKEPTGLYSVKEFGWTKESPYDQPGLKPFIRSRGLFGTRAKAEDDATWVNYPEMRREK